MARRRPDRALSAEERELWRRVEATATPLHPERLEPRAGARPPETAPPPKPEPPRADLSALEIGGRQPRERTFHDPAPTLETRLARQPVQMDAKAYGRMRRGKLAVEGRIDLHGLTLAEAHPRLNHFILNAYATDKRLVLVITGKGRERDGDWAMPTPRGVLRHQVPQWLGSGPLGPLVLQVTPAHRSHGGAGAYYVYLRRRG